MNIQEKLVNTIKKHNLIKKGNKLIVGVSGGSDSVCLLHLLNEIKDEFDLKLIVAHVNYGTRDGSDSDEALVKSLTEKFGLEFKTLDEVGIGKRETGNLEEAFREARYGFFLKLMKSEKADRIAVAHNSDDNVETILMFFLRGSGLRGLTGMEYKHKNVIRPLLDVSKKEILQYLKDNNIEYGEDVTNKDTRFIRNRIRHELIPYMEENYNENIRKTLIDSSAVMRDDFDYIVEATERAFDYIGYVEDNKIMLDLGRFEKLHLSLQRGVLRLAIEKLAGNLQGVSQSDINETIRILKEGKGGSRKDIKGLSFMKKSGKIVVRKISNYTNS